MVGNCRRNVIGLLLASSVFTTVVVAPETATADPVSVVTILASSAFAATSITAAAITFSWATFAASAALGGALYAVGMSQQRSPAMPVQDRTTNIRQSIGVRMTHYGRVRHGGQLIFAHESGGPDEVGDGDDHREKFLHLVFAMAGHEIDGYEKWYIGDQEVEYDEVTGFPVDIGDSDDDDENPKTNYHLFVRRRFNLGAADQVAFPELIAESEGKWTEGHRGIGIPLVYYRLRQNAKVFKTGIPNFSCVLRGKKVRNLATNSREWSANAVWCLADYLRTLGTTLGQLDSGSWVAGGAVAGETVPKRLGGNGKRYTCNGTIPADAVPKNTLEDLCTTLGEGCIVWTGGKWQLKVGAWTPPVLTLTEDDVRGPVKIQTRYSGSDRFEVVKGTFIGPETDYAPDSYPAIKLSSVSDVENARTAEFALPFTADSAEAQRLAKIRLYRQQEQIVVSSTVGLRGLMFGIGDNVRLTLERPGFEGKTFECRNWKFSHTSDGEMFIDVTFRETSPAVWNWNADEKSFERNNTKLPRPSYSPPPGISLSSSIVTANENVVGKLNIELTSQFGSLGLYEVQYKRSDKARWVSLGRQPNRTFEIANVHEIPYDIRARVTNPFGIPSDWRTVMNYIPTAFTNPPPDVDDFDGAVIGDSILLSWAPVDAPDLSHYLIRWTPDTAGASWQETTKVVARVARPGTSVSVPARDGAYFIRAVDKFGNKSLNPALLTTTVPRSEEYNAIVTVNESPDFAGAKTNVELRSGAISGLTLATGATRGTYAFASWQDVGDVYAVRVKSSIKIKKFDRNVVLFDSVPGLFDNRSGMFEDSFNIEGLDAYVQVSYRASSTDDWSRWYRATNNLLVGRYFRFRTILESDDTNAAPIVTNLSVTLDMPEAQQSGNDVVSSAAGTPIVFAKPFRELGAIGVTMQDANTGDYYRITAKSRTGFTIRFYNSSGTGISRTFDWIARGIGKVLS